MTTPLAPFVLATLRELHADSTAGTWGKGASTHETVSRRDRGSSYRIAEFRHAADGAFCDAAHAFMPALLEMAAAAQVYGAALDHIFGKNTDWKRIVEHRLTPPWPLPHHLEAMGLTPNKPNA